MTRKPVRFLPALLAALVAVPASAETRSYQIDPEHTYPRFEYSHLGYSTQSGRFNRTGGRIVLDRVARTGSVEVSIDVASIDSGLPAFDEHLLGPEFFDARNFPAIVFKSSVVKFIGERISSVDGNLTVKGITRPVTLRVSSFKCMPHPLAKKEACGADATATIRRSEFNAGKFAPLVGDDVTLVIAVEAIEE